MAKYKVEDVEGIGPTFAQKLGAAGIKDTDALLAATKTPKQRKDLSAKTGIDDKKILKWANMVDLYRVKGIGSEYSELLEAAGVDTVPDLAKRIPANLAAKLAEVKETKKLTRKVPSAAECEKWVAEAKALPRVLEY